MLGDHLSLERIEGVKQPDGEGRARSYAAASGDVGVVVDFHATLDIQITEHLTDRRMHYLIELLAVFDFGIDDAIAVLEEWREVATVYVAVFVDRRR